MAARPHVDAWPLARERQGAAQRAPRAWLRAAPNRARRARATPRRARRYVGAGSLPAELRWQVVSYFIIVVVVGRFFVLNLFIAVLLSNISDVKDEKKAAERRRKVPATAHACRPACANARARCPPSRALHRAPTAASSAPCGVPRCANGPPARARTCTVSSPLTAAPRAPRAARAAWRRLVQAYFLGKLLLVQQSPPARAGSQAYISTKDLLVEREMAELNAEPPVWDRDGGLRAISFGDTEALVADARRERDALLTVARAASGEADGAHSTSRYHHLRPPLLQLHSAGKSAGGVLGLRGLGGGGGKKAAAGARHKPAAGGAFALRRQRSVEPLSAAERDAAGGVAMDGAGARRAGVRRTRSAEDLSSSRSARRAGDGNGDGRGGAPSVAFGAGKGAAVGGVAAGKYAHSLRSSAAAPVPLETHTRATPADARQGVDVRAAHAAARADGGGGGAHAGELPAAGASDGSAGWLDAAAEALLPAWAARLIAPAVPEAPAVGKPRPSRPRSLAEQSQLTTANRTGGRAGSAGGARGARDDAAEAAATVAAGAASCTSGPAADGVAAPWADRRSAWLHTNQKTHASRMATGSTRAARARARLRAAWRRFKQGDDRACGCLEPTHPLRRLAVAVIEHRWFERGILALIFCSSLSLAIDTPGPTAGWVEDARPTLRALEWVFTILFLVEMLLKMVARGLFRTSPAAYFRSAWNWLDFCLVVTSVTARVGDVVESLTQGGVAFDAQLLAALRTLRLLRVLRPLRVLTHNEGLKLVVNSLIRACPEVFNVLLIFLLFVTVFAILGVQLFAGKLSSCSDPAVDTRARCVGTFVDESGIERERGWFRAQLASFDNFAYAAMALFELAHSEMWPDVMLLAMGARGVDEAPLEDVRDAPASQIALSLYFVAWTLIGAFFVINLFVGVVIDNFNELKEVRAARCARMRHADQNWSAAMDAPLALRH